MKIRSAVYITVIRCNPWIDAGATVLAAVSIGDNAVVAAGAVVNKDAPHNSFVAGVPTKFDKHL